MVHAKGPTERPDLCEGVEDFAVKVNANKGLVVLHNPKNKLMSIFECELDNSGYCRSLFYGTAKQYCSFEVTDRQSAFKKMGVIRTADSLYSISTGSAISKVFQAKELAGDVQDVLKRKNVETCYDLNKIFVF